MTKIKKMTKMKHPSLMDSIKAKWNAVKKFFRQNIRYAANATTHKLTISKTVSKELDGQSDLLVAQDPKQPSYITLPKKEVSPMGFLSKAAKEGEEVTVHFLGNGTTASLRCETDIKNGFWVYATEKGTIFQLEGLELSIKELQEKMEKEKKRQEKILKKNKKNEKNENFLKNENDENENEKIEEKNEKLKEFEKQKEDFKPEALTPIGIALTSAKAGSTAEVLTTLVPPTKKA